MKMLKISSITFASASAACTATLAKLPKLFVLNEQVLNDNLECFINGDSRLY